MKHLPSDCRERTSLTRSLLNDPVAETLVFQGQLHSGQAALAQACHICMQSFGHRDPKVLCLWAVKHKTHLSIGQTMRVYYFCFVQFQMKSSTLPKTETAADLGLSDNCDQDTKSNLTVISLWGSRLTYDHHQERPSDAKLYKYTDSSNLAPTIRLMGWNDGLKSKSKIFVRVQKAFRKVWQPQELWFTVQLLRGTCKKMTFIASQPFG